MEVVIEFDSRLAEFVTKEAKGNIGEKGGCVLVSPGAIFAAPRILKEGADLASLPGYSKIFSVESDYVLARTLDGGAGTSGEEVVNFITDLNGNLCLISCGYISSESKEFIQDIEFDLTRSTICFGPDLEIFPILDKHKGLIEELSSYLSDIVLSEESKVVAFPL